MDLTTVVTPDVRTIEAKYVGTLRELNVFIDAESLTMYKIGKPVYILPQMYFTISNICYKYSIHVFYTR